MTYPPVCKKCGGHMTLDPEPWPSEYGEISILICDDCEWWRPAFLPIADDLAEWMEPDDENDD